MKICILGSHDLRAGSRGGTVYMAETLSAMGHEITYVPSQVSLLLRLLLQRRGLSKRDILARQIEIVQATSYILAPWRAVAMADRLGLGSILFEMNRWVEVATRSRLLSQRFDLCVASAAGTVTLADRIHADRYVYRRNDILSGFRGVPRALMEFELHALRSGRFSVASCVNEYLAADLSNQIPDIKTNVVPNGISVDLYEQTRPDAELMPFRDRNVLYVGGLTDWVDVSLIAETALRLPEHRFHVVGPWHIPLPEAPLPSNIRVHGPVDHAEAVAKMKACAVGIIPSGVGNIGRMVVKPIKYYEYLAAGMGVAATTYAGEGLEPFAAIGDGPDLFAQAILKAPAIAMRDHVAIDDQVRTMDWRSLVPRILEI